MRASPVSARGVRRRRHQIHKAGPKLEGNDSQSDQSTDVPMFPAVLQDETGIFPGQPEPSGAIGEDLVQRATSDPAPGSPATPGLRPGPDPRAVSAEYGLQGDQDRQAVTPDFPHALQDCHDTSGVQDAEREGSVELLTEFREVLDVLLRRHMLSLCMESDHSMVSGSADPRSGALYERSRDDYDRRYMIGSQMEKVISHVHSTSERMHPYGKEQSRDDIRRGQNRRASFRRRALGKEYERQLETMVFSLRLNLLQMTKLAFLYFAGEHARAEDLLHTEIIPMLQVPQAEGPQAGFNASPQEAGPNGNAN